MYACHRIIQWNNSDSRDSGKGAGKCWKWKSKFEDSGNYIWVPQKYMFCSRVSQYFAQGRILMNHLMLKTNVIFYVAHYLQNPSIHFLRKMHAQETKRWGNKQNTAKANYLEFLVHASVHPDVQNCLTKVGLQELMQITDLFCSIRLTTWDFL